MIRRFVITLVILFSGIFPAISQELTLLTPEEIWQEGASWEEIWGDCPIRYHYFVNGAVEHEGKTYLKIKYFYEDSNGRIDHEIPLCGINVDGNKVSVLVDRQFDSAELGHGISLPYCDFDDVRMGQGFSHSWIQFNEDGKSVISNYDYPVLKSKSVLECPDIPGRALEIYSTGEDVYASWEKLWTRMIVPGLGAVSCFGGLIDPFLNFIPAVGWSVQTLYFKDGQGREIFRHPHYDRIMEIVSGVDGITSESNRTCKVYTISGNLVLPDATPELIDRLHKGIYIKHQGNKAEKILVR